MPNTAVVYTTKVPFSNLFITLVAQEKRSFFLRLKKVSKRFILSNTLSILCDIFDVTENAASPVYLPHYFTNLLKNITVLKKNAKSDTLLNPFIFFKKTILPYKKYYAFLKLLCNKLLAFLRNKKNALLSKSQTKTFIGFLKNEDETTIK